MYKRYHIDTSPAELDSTNIGTFQIIRDENCLNCGRCISLCIYDVHGRDPDDPRKMSDPLSLSCKNCFSCIQNCPRQALKMIHNAEFKKLGNTYWTPQIIQTIWNEAEEGEIPVYGAGYRGPFKGTGFDVIWTDMSEIVRPTRDGIHGREYIATSVDLGSKLLWIQDFENLSLPNSYEIKIPMLLDTHPLGLNKKNITLAIIKAAHQLGTFAFLDIKNYADELEPYLESIALRCSFDEYSQHNSALLKKVRLVEIIPPQKFSYTGLEKAIKHLKKQNPAALISLGMTDSLLPEDIFKCFYEKGADVLHLYADNSGKSQDGNLFIADAIRELHLKSVQNGSRDEFTIIGTGGIAAAEHVPKIVICGADAAVLDLSLLVAMGCRVCEVCETERCPADIGSLKPELATQRIINMICAWRDQLLEILSAMGIRDVRRLRGEVGRAMFYEEIEKESFEFIFNKNSKSG